jgi:hypothetical protein
MSLQTSDCGLQEGIGNPSPFTRVLALGYYDGPTEGLAQCGNAGPTFRFVMLDNIAADPEELRIFAVSPLPADAMDRAAQVLALHESPRWPVWVPGWQPECKPAIDQILQETGPAEWLIATLGDLLGEVLVARRTSPQWAPIDRAGLLAFLGLSEGPPWLASPAADNGR